MEQILTDCLSNILLELIPMTHPGNQLNYCCYLLFLLIDNLIHADETISPIYTLSKYCSITD